MGAGSALEELIDKKGTEIALSEITTAIRKDLIRAQIESLGGETIEHDAIAGWEHVQEHDALNTARAGRIGPLSFVEEQRAIAIETLEKIGGDEEIGSVIKEAGKKSWRSTSKKIMGGLVWLVKTVVPLALSIYAVYEVYKALPDVNDCTASCKCKCKYDPTSPAEADNKCIDCAASCGEDDCSAQSQCVPPDTNGPGASGGQGADTCYPSTCLNVIDGKFPNFTKDPIEWPGSILFIFFSGIIILILNKFLPDSWNRNIIMGCICILIISSAAAGWFWGGRVIKWFIDGTLAVPLNEMARKDCTEDSPPGTVLDMNQCCNSYCDAHVGPNAGKEEQGEYTWGLITSCGGDLILLIVLIFILYIIFGIVYGFEVRGRSSDGPKQDIAPQSRTVWGRARSKLSLNRDKWEIQDYVIAGSVIIIVAITAWNHFSAEEEEELGCSDPDLSDCTLSEVYYSINKADREKIKDDIHSDTFLCGERAIGGDGCNDHQCDIGIGGVCVECIAHVDFGSAPDDDSNSTSYNEIFGMIAVITLYKYRAKLKGVLGLPQDIGSQVVKGIYKGSMGIIRTLKVSFEEAIIARIKTKMFNSDIKVAAQAGARALEGMGAVATGAKKGLATILGMVGEGVAIGLGEAMPFINFIIIFGMIADAEDISSYRSYIANDNLVIRLRNTYDSLHIMSLFLDPDNTDHVSHLYPCKGHQYPSIAQLSLIVIIKDSKFTEAIPFQKIQEAYIKATSTINNKILDLLIDNDPKSNIPLITIQNYNEYIGWGKCMPMTGIGPISPCNENNYCNWYRKLTHLYKKMIASYPQKDQLLFDEIKKEMGATWESDLPSYSTIQSEYPKPNNETWKYKDLIKNYNIFESCSVPSTCENSCNLGDWKNTAPPNYDCTGISFTEGGCYLFNKIIEWESAEWDSTKDPHPPSFVPNERLRLSIKDRLKINYTNHYRLMSGYAEAEMISATPIIISKPIDSIGTKLPLYYPSSSLVSLVCKKGMNVMKELNALSKGECHTSDYSGDCHACGLFGDARQQRGVQHAKIDCINDTSIYTFMARGTGQDWQDGAQEAWLPELYGVEYDEISGLCKYNTKEPKWPQIKGEEYCHRMGKTNGPFARCEEDFSEDEDDPADVHSCEGLVYDYCGGDCEEAGDPGSYSIFCETSQFIFGQTFTNTILRET